jgi:hypothetical protein
MAPTRNSGLPTISTIWLPFLLRIAGADTFLHKRPFDSDQGSPFGEGLSFLEWLEGKGCRGIGLQSVAFTEKI